MTIFYFTGTGNSLFAARKIADATGATLVSIPQVFAKQETYADDKIGFIYPQYAVGLPKMVRSFILKNEFDAEYFFAVDLYAHIRMNALGEIAGIITLDYGAYLKTPWNFIFAFNPPKRPETILEKAEGSLERIISDIKGNKRRIVKARKRHGAATAFFGETRFRVSEDCNRCGTCAQVCPANNIEVIEKTVFGNECENCFACVNLCPSHAIYSSKKMQKRRQYRNPLISVNEIIEANNDKL